MTHNKTIQRLDAAINAQRAQLASTRLHQVAAIDIIALVHTSRRVCLVCCCCCRYCYIPHPCHGTVYRAYRITSCGSDTRTESGGSVEPRKRSRCSAVVGHTCNQCSRVCGAPAVPHLRQTGCTEESMMCRIIECGKDDGNDRCQVGMLLLLLILVALRSVLTKQS